MLLKKSKSLNIKDGKLHNSQENVVIDTCEDNDVERKDICAGSNTDDSSVRNFPRKETFIKFL